MPRTRGGARGGGAWDNNDGADWHTSLRPFVTTSVYNHGDGTTYVTIGYADGALSPVVLHYGTDGWQGVTEVSMSATYGGHQAQIAVPEGAETLDFVFTDGAGRWENNYGMNWSISLR